MFKQMTDAQINKLKKEASKNNPIALNELGLLYLQGIEIEKNIQKAFECFEASMKLDCDLAIVNLANCYAHGIHIEKNIRKAYELYKEAAEKGEEKAIFNIEYLCDQNPEIAIEYNKKPFRKLTTMVVFDILGFSNFVKLNEIDKILELYQLLIDLLNDVNKLSFSVPITMSEDATGAVMVEGVISNLNAKYFSDSFVIWMDYKINRKYMPYWTSSKYEEKNPLLLFDNPNKVFFEQILYYNSFIVLCMHFFCKALKLGIPLRGCLSTQRCHMDAEKGIYIGDSLIESVRGESSFNALGIHYAPSFRHYHPIYNKYFIPYTKYIKSDKKNNLSIMALDWPRYWLEENSEKEFKDIISSLNKDINYANYYENTSDFFEFSQANSDWFECIDCKSSVNIDDYFKLVKKWLFIK